VREIVPDRKPMAPLLISRARGADTVLEAKQVVVGDDWGAGSIASLCGLIEEAKGDAAMRAAILDSLRAASAHHRPLGLPPHRIPERTIESLRIARQPFGVAAIVLGFRWLKWLAAWAAPIDRHKANGYRLHQRGDGSSLANTRSHYNTDAVGLTPTKWLPIAKSNKSRT
jgi:hypothetical protein